MASTDELLDQYNRGLGLTQPGSTDELLQRYELSKKEITDDEFNATFVGQDKLGPPGAGAGTRALLSFFGDNLEEQTAVFKMLNPQGDLLRVPVTGDVLYRNDPSEDYRKVDAGFFEAFGLDLTGYAKEAFRDVADVTGDIPEIVGEGAGMFFMRRPGGGKFVGDLARLATGGMLGEAAQQTAQELMGTSRQDPTQMGGLIIGAGVEGTIGGLAGAGIGALTNLILGRGAAKLSAEGVEAVQAAERLDTLMPLPSQVAPSPFLKLLQKQSQALFSRIGNYLTEQEKRTAKALTSLSDPAERSRFMADLSRESAKVNKDMTEAAIQAMDVKRRGGRSGGRALQQGIEAWWKASGLDVDNAYKAARSVEEPIFDIDRVVAGQPSLRQVADELNAGTLVRKDGGTDTFRVDSLQPEVQKLVDDVLKMEARIERTNVSAFDQLKALRQRVDDFTLAGPQGPRINQAVASKLKSAIVRTMENPVNDTPDFVNLWKKANSMAADRFKRREQMAVVSTLQNTQPSQLVNTLARPGQVDNLTAIRRATNDKEWAKFEEAVITNFMLDPPSMLRRLDDLDEPTANLLFSPQRRQILRDVAEEFQRFDSIGVKNALQRQTRMQSFLRDVTETKDTGRITQLKRLVDRAGGRDSDLGRSTQAALINEVWEKSKVREQGIFRVDFNKLQRTLASMEERGLLDLLTPEQLRTLRDVEIMQDFSRMGVQDAGTSIQAASAVADVRGGGVRGLATLVETFTVGRLLTNKGVLRFLLGKGRKRPLDTAMIKLVGAAGSNIATDLETQEEYGRDVLDLIETGKGFMTEIFS